MHSVWLEIIKTLISLHDKDLPDNLVINRWYYPDQFDRKVGCIFYHDDYGKFCGLIEDIKSNVSFSIEMNVEHIKYYNSKMDEEHDDVIIPMDIDEAEFFQLSTIYNLSDITYDNVQDIIKLYDKMYNYFL